MALIIICTDVNCIITEIFTKSKQLRSMIAGILSKKKGMALIITCTNDNCIIAEIFTKSKQLRSIIAGILSKKKGLWSRTRMFLLTEGPRLFYVDPKEKVLKV